MAKQKKKFKLLPFLQGLGKPLGKVLDIAGDIVPGAPGDLLDNIGGIISGEPNLTPEEKAKALELAMEDKKMLMADRANARDMQTNIATSSNSTSLSKNYVYYLASFWSVSAVAYFFLVTFLAEDTVNKDISHTILGFLLGTAVSSILAFFFGTSESEKNALK